MVVSKLAELLIFGFAPLVLGIMALPESADAEERTIQGEVSYRERIALPANAVLTVEVTTLSLADAPAAILGKQEIKSPGQIPIKFAINFNTSALQKAMNYAIHARITVDNRLWFVNDQRETLDPMSSHPVSLVLRSAR